MNANQPTPMPEMDVNADTVRQLPKYVRVLDERANGMVVFEFAMGWPDLTAELAMPRQAFDDFCEQHQVIFVTEAPEQLGGTHDEH